MSYIATWVDPFLKDLFERREGDVQGEPRRFVPLADVMDSPEAWFLVLDMPGVERKDVTLDVVDGVLTITGRSTAPVLEATPVRKERPTGEFRRSFNLEEARVDLGAISATMKDGVLRVRVPKAGPAKTHRIEVKDE